MTPSFSARAFLIAWHPIREALEHYELALAIDADFTLAEFNSGLTYQVIAAATRKEAQLQRSERTSRLVGLVCVSVCPTTNNPVGRTHGSFADYVETRQRKGPAGWRRRRRVRRLPAEETNSSKYSPGPVNSGPVPCLRAPRT